MSGFINWIATQADERVSADGATTRQERAPQTYVGPVGKSCGGNARWQQTPTDDFPRRMPFARDVEASGEEDWNRDPDLWLYRKKTTSLLRRYMRWSLEAGRLPSLLGRELFRAKISAYTATTFEARVIFLHDVERLLDRLPSFDRKIVARIVLQEYDHGAAARILQCDRKTIERRLPNLIDELSQAFLEADMLDRVPTTNQGAV